LFIIEAKFPTFPSSNFLLLPHHVHGFRSNFLLLLLTALHGPASQWGFPDSSAAIFAVVDICWGSVSSDSVEIDDDEDKAEEAEEDVVVDDAAEDVPFSMTFVVAPFGHSSLEHALA
jgi:hypothetical protein